MNYLLVVLTLITAFFIRLLVFDFNNIVKGRAPSLSSSKKATDNITEIFDFNQNFRVADFGAGYGRIINHIKDHDVGITGYEINPILYTLLKIRFRKYKNVKILRRDFLTSNLNNYDVITIYGVGDIMHKLENKIKESKITNLKIISNKFTFPTLENKNKIGGVYLYEL